MKSKTLVLCLCMMFLLSGCQSVAVEEQKDLTAYTKDLFAMDTHMSLTIYSTTGSDALNVAAEEVLLLDKLFSATDENSEIYKANAHDNDSFLVSDETAEVISASLDLGKRTGGALDISIYPIMQAWGFTLGSMQVPSPDVLSRLLPLVDYTQIILQDNVLSLPQGMMIDLGGIAKGYCGDKLAEIMKDYDVSSALFSLGGNIHTVGTKPDGSLWRVAVQDPLDEINLLGVVEVSDKAVVTSGGYERFFVSDGQIYWHIMDPSSGTPVRNGIISVTVVSESGTLCDALSTALFVMGKQEALKHYWEHRDFEMVLVTEDGTVTITPGLKDFFSLLDQEKYILEIAAQ